jgi:hypothetical protein
MATGVVTFPFILQQDAAADADVVGEIVTSTLVPHVKLEYYGVDYANVFTQATSADTAENVTERVKVAFTEVDSKFLADISGFLSDVSQSVQTFNKFLGGYDHREFVSTACTALEGLEDGLAKITGADKDGYLKNIFEQLVGINASMITLDVPNGTMSFDFQYLSNFKAVSKVTTTYTIDVEQANSITISSSVLSLTYPSSAPPTATRDWFVETNLYSGAGSDLVSYDITAPDSNQ